MPPSDNNRKPPTAAVNLIGLFKPPPSAFTKMQLSANLDIEQPEVVLV